MGWTDQTQKMERGNRRGIRPRLPALHGQKAVLLWYDEIQG